MAYRSYLKYYGAGNQATVMTDTSTYLQAMGWTLEKAVSGSRHFLSTRGEDGTHQKFWLDLQVSGNYINKYVYSFINTTTDTGYGGSYGNIATSIYRVDCSAAGYLKMYGSKDLVYWGYSSSSTPNQTGDNWFGVVPYDLIIPKPYAILANSEVAGAGVTIEVNNTDGFQRNDYYQIFDPATGCRERIQITAINAGVSVTATLANNYSAGSIIAYLPHSGFISSQGTAVNVLYPCCPIGVSGTGNAVSANGFWTYTSFGQMIAVGGGSADYRNNLYLMSPIGFYGAGGSEIVGSANSAIGYCKENFLRHVGLSLADIIGTVDAGNTFVNGTATAGGANTMTDAGAAWGVDALVGKILILTGGTGAGQTRWITANTATQITVGQNWVTNPVAGTTYMLVDGAYRQIGSSSNSTYLMALETIGEP